MTGPIRNLIDVNQHELNAMFKGITFGLRHLYNMKNLKYSNSFNREHKTFKDAFYNIKRKYARLETMSKKRKLSPEELSVELVDMAVYSIMCLMKFMPDEIRSQDDFLQFIEMRCK
jgi:hypothetical protein